MVVGMVAYRALQLLQARVRDPLGVRHLANENVDHFRVVCDQVPRQLPHRKAVMFPG